MFNVVHVGEEGPCCRSKLMSTGVIASGAWVRDLVRVPRSAVDPSFFRRAIRSGLSVPLLTGRDVHLVCFSTWKSTLYNLLGHVCTD